MKTRHGIDAVNDVPTWLVWDITRPLRITNIGSATAIVMQPGFTTYWEVAPGETFEINQEFPDRLSIAGWVTVTEEP